MEVQRAAHNKGLLLFIRRNNNKIFDVSSAGLITRLRHPVSRDGSVSQDVADPSKGQRAFTVCTRTTSLTFDLPHRIRKTSQELEEKNFHMGKKVKNPSGEQQRSIPLQDGHNTSMSCDQSYINTSNEYECMNSSYCGWTTRMSYERVRCWKHSWIDEFFWPLVVLMEAHSPKGAFRTPWQTRLTALVLRNTTNWFNPSLIGVVLLQQTSGRWTPSSWPWVRSWAAASLGWCWKAGGGTRRWPWRP